MTTETGATGGLLSGRPPASDLQLVAPVQNEGLTAIMNLARFTPTDQEHGELRDVRSTVGGPLLPTD